MEGSLDCFQEYIESGSGKTWEDIRAAWTTFTGLSPRLWRPLRLRTLLKGHPQVRRRRPKAAFQTQPYRASLHRPRTHRSVVNWYLHTLGGGGGGDALVP